MDSSNRNPTNLPVPSPYQNATTTTASVSVHLPNTTISPPISTVVPLPEMLIRLQDYQARVVAAFNHMQQQLHDVDMSISQNHQRLDEYLCTEVTLGVTDPLRRHLRDDHPGTMTVLEFKTSLESALARNRKQYAWLELRKGQVLQRVSTLEQS